MEPELAAFLPSLIESVWSAIDANADEVTALDQAIGDGDHVFNLQRGLDALRSDADNLGNLTWPAALEKIGMTLLSTMGGASGSLYGTLFIKLGKCMRDRAMCLQNFADAFEQAVEAVKARGKADLGDKTMLDVLIPCAATLKRAALENGEVERAVANACNAAEVGVESTREMIATRGRASFLGDKARGHLDAGAKTSQLIICAVARAILGDIAHSSVA